jgi:short-subunit dehydrogenase
LAGIRGLPSLSAYCASKMALRALAESIRIEEHAHGIHVGLIQVGITEIEHNKETIAADGSLQVLQDRAKGKVQTTEQVAHAVLENLRKRTFITTLTAIGKLNAFLQPRAPMLVEKIILNSLDKFAEKSK